MLAKGMEKGELLVCGVLREESWTQSVCLALEPEGQGLRQSSEEGLGKGRGVSLSGFCLRRQ